MMAKKNDFVVFILSHGRADKVDTYNRLKKDGYTGDIVIICDDEDKDLPKYKQKFSKVEVFHKADINCDTMDLQGNNKIVLFAREHVFDVARKLGYRYFLELDDDYCSFQYRKIEGNRLKAYEVKDLDSVINAYLRFLKSTPTKTIAFSQGGDNIGGIENTSIYTPKRKAMNAFFCDVERPFHFLGRINEDTNMYLSEGMRGGLVFTLNLGGIMLRQGRTQANSGGLTDIYLDVGTYIKSFYSVMINPSAVKIAEMGDKHKRIHHHINWRYAVPKILHERHKK